MSSRQIMSMAATTRNCYRHPVCTLIILRRPDHDWPLLVAANRDEMAGRPWDPPARHWRDRENVVAGIDRLAGGTWMGLTTRASPPASQSQRFTGPRSDIALARRSRAGSSGSCRRRRCRRGTGGSRRTQLPVIQSSDRRQRDAFCSAASALTIMAVSRSLKSPTGCRC